jgi:hypothetical protein
VQTPIDIVYHEGKRLSELLTAQNEISLSITTQANQQKILLLSTASWFEFRLCEAMRVFSSVHSQQHAGIEGVIRAKAIERQYHTWFDWKSKSATGFYRLFGSCGDGLRVAANGEPALKAGEKAFLELGQLRNELVHQNFATFPINLTSEDIYAQYMLAERYISWVESQLTHPKFGRA